MSRARTTRREWLQQTATGTARPAVSPRGELVNTLEFESEAGRVLAPDVFRGIAGSDRAAFDRITFRPRMMVNCLNLDLSIELFGARLFAPIVVGPVADQGRYHPEGELATVRGASAAKAAVVVSARTSRALEAVAAASSTPFLAQVFADDRLADTTARARAAEQAGCRALVVTVGATDAGPSRRARIDWAAVDALGRAVSIPIVVKGVTTPEAAREALDRGARGLVVSTYGRAEAPGQPAPLDRLEPVADAVAGRVPVLVDGGFRRGTDVMKALALGARAVLVARPVMWGLAAYGADGVQAVLELLQTDLARVMACCGTPDLASISRRHVALHRPLPPRAPGA